MANKMIDKYTKKDIHQREEQLVEALNKDRESSEEKRPHNKFSKDINMEEPQKTKKFKGVFDLKKQLQKK